MQPGLGTSIATQAHAREHASSALRADDYQWQPLKAGNSRGRWLRPLAHPVVLGIAVLALVGSLAVLATEFAGDSWAGRAIQRAAVGTALGQQRRPTSVGHTRSEHGYVVRGTDGFMRVVQPPTGSFDEMQAWWRSQEQSLSIVWVTRARRPVDAWLAPMIRTDKYWIAARTLDADPRWAWSNDELRASAEAFAGALGLSIPGTAWSNDPGAANWAEASFIPRGVALNAIIVASALIVLICLPAQFWWWRGRTRQRRWDRGRCPRCGYDLSATNPPSDAPGWKVCPECGCASTARDEQPIMSSALPTGS